MAKRTEEHETVRTTECAVCGDVFVVEIGPKGGRPQMTCSPQCARKRHRLQNYEWSKARECPPDKHGTLVGYSTYLCRCDTCRRAMRDYRRHLRKRALSDK